MFFYPGQHQLKVIQKNIKARHMCQPLFVVSVLVIGQQGIALLFHMEARILVVASVIHQSMHNKKHGFGILFLPDMK